MKTIKLNNKGIIHHIGLGLLIAGIVAAIVATGIYVYSRAHTSHAGGLNYAYLGTIPGGQFDQIDILGQSAGPQLPVSSVQVYGCRQTSNGMVNNSTFSHYSSSAEVVSGASLTSQQIDSAQNQTHSYVKQQVNSLLNSRPTAAVVNNQNQYDPLPPIYTINFMFKLTNTSPSVPSSAYSPQLQIAYPEETSTGKYATFYDGVGSSVSWQGNVGSYSFTGIPVNESIYYDINDQVNILRKYTAVFNGTTSTTTKYIELVQPTSYGYDIPSLGSYLPPSDVYYTNPSPGTPISQDSFNNGTLYLGMAVNSIPDCSSSTTSYASYGVPSSSNHLSHVAVKSTTSNNSSNNTTNTSTSSQSSKTTNSNTTATKLTTTQTQTCQNHFSEISTILGRINTRTSNQINLLSSTASSVENFYTRQNRAVSNYQQLIAAVSGEETTTQKGYSNMKTDSNFSCNSSNPKGTIITYQADLKAEINNLQNLRAAVNNLINAVAKANGVSVSMSNNSSLEGLS